MYRVLSIYSIKYTFYVLHTNDSQPGGCPLGRKSLTYYMGSANSHREVIFYKFIFINEGQKRKT